MTNLSGYFKRNYSPLRGKDWLKNIPAEERKAFSHFGMELHDYGRMGGKARAATARRDSKGRFVCANT